MCILYLTYDQRSVSLCPYLSISGRQYSSCAPGGYTDEDFHVKPPGQTVRTTIPHIFTIQSRQSRQSTKLSLQSSELRLPHPLTLWRVCIPHNVPTPLPLREGRQAEIIWTRKLPPPPHWDRRAIQPNHIKFRTFSALAPIWTTPINESSELTRGAL